MLKNVLLNGKRLPLPVPLKTLGELVYWFESSIMKPGETITKLRLDQRDIDSDLVANNKKLPLTEKSVVEIQVDTPAELFVQTIEAMRNLVMVVNQGIRIVAVNCWQARPTEPPKEVQPIQEDLELILELIQHIKTLVDTAIVDISPLQGIEAMLVKVVSSIALARGNSDWKSCAKLYLNRLEPLLKDLMSEADQLQVSFMTHHNSTSAVKLKNSHKADVG